MKGAKKIADSITVARFLLGLGLAYVGWSRGAAGLELAVWIMIANWTGDCIDGPIARRSRPYYHTWVGDHDLEIDMAVSVGLLTYLALAGFVDIRLAGAYVLIWLLIFSLLGVPLAIGMLFQAPVYGWFIWVAIREAPSAGWFLPGWIVAAIVLTWPKFPKKILPGFLSGMLRLGGQDHPENSSPSTGEGLAPDHKANST